METYNEERLENAKHLLKTTDRIFGFAAGNEWLLNFLRLNVLPMVAKHIFSIEGVRQFVFPLVSQIGITYRHSSLSNHAGDEDFEIKAGDRMPYCLVDGKSIYDKLNLPQFHLLGFSTEQNNFRALKNEIESRYSESVNFQAFFLSPEVEQAFGTNKDFGLLLRPDNHVGLISSDISSSRVREYLSESIGQ